MKITYPSTKVKNHDKIILSKIRKNEKSPTSKSPKLISQLKKCGSLDLSYNRQKKNDELQKIYRISTCDKKFRTKSTSSSKSTTDFKNYLQTVPRKFQNNKKQLFYPQKKIFLKTQKKQSYYRGDLKSNLQILCEKLQKCIQIKSQKLFAEQYAQIFKFSQSFHSKQNNNQLYSFIISFRKCQEIRHSNKIQLLNQKLLMQQKDKLGLNVQIHKSKIKEESLNLQINKLKDKNSELSKQLKKIKQKCYENQLVQTSAQKFNDKNMDNGNGVNVEFTKLIQQLRVLKQKENNMNILIEQLQKQGINLEKVYKRALKRAKSQAIEKNCQNSEADDSQCPQQTKPTKKSSHHTSPKQIKNNNQSFADQSIIDSIEDLSIDYAEKQTPIQMFVPKQVYVRQKQMAVQLKNKLKLDFGCLYYQEQISGNSHGYSDQGFQTI